MTTGAGLLWQAVLPKVTTHSNFWLGLVRLGYCFTLFQRLRLYNGAPFSRLLLRPPYPQRVVKATKWGAVIKP